MLCTSGPFFCWAPAEPAVTTVATRTIDWNRVLLEALIAVATVIVTTASRSPSQKQS